MLHRDRSRLVVADLRIDILNRILIYLFRQGKLRIQIADRLFGDPHLLDFRITERIIVSRRSVLYLCLLLSVQLHFITLRHQIHRLDACNLCQRNILHILFQRHAVHVCGPDLRSIDTLIAILYIGQIHHNLRQGAGAGLDPKDLIPVESGGKHYLRAKLIPAPAPGQAGKT